MINIVMPVRDRWKETTQAFASLASCTENEEISLTIIDDMSCPDVSDRLDGLAGLGTYCFTTGPMRRSSLISIHVVHNTENLGVGGSKNRGVIESEKRFGRGDYLYFSDNDVIFTDGWLDALVGAYSVSSKISGIRILGGYAHPYNGTNQVLTYEKYKCHPQPVVHEKNAVDGLSWLLTWDTWDKYGTLMDNARGVRQSEDWEYCQRIRNDGYRVGVVYPHVIINNGVVDTFGDRIPDADNVERIEKARMA